MYKTARDNRQFARLVQDFLVIDNEKFKVDNTGKIVKDLTYSRPPPQNYRNNNRHVDNRVNAIGHHTGQQMNSQTHRFRQQPFVSNNQAAWTQNTHL